MSERKPKGMSFETWVDRAIREAEERGAFDDLPGAGTPIPGAGRPDDELWWVRAKLEREKLTFVPPSLGLRKEIESINDLAATKNSEAEVRALVDDLNARIMAAIRTGISGPRVPLLPVKPEQVLSTWRGRRGTPASAARTLADSGRERRSTPTSAAHTQDESWRERRGTPTAASARAEAGRTPDPAPKRLPRGRRRLFRRPERS